MAGPDNRTLPSARIVNISTVWFLPNPEGSPRRCQLGAYPRSPTKLSSSTPYTSNDIETFYMSQPRPKSNLNCQRAPGSVRRVPSLPLPARLTPISATCSPTTWRRCLPPRWGGSQHPSHAVLGCPFTEPPKCITCITCIRKNHRNRLFSQGLCTKTATQKNAPQMHKPPHRRPKLASHQKPRDLLTRSTTNSIPPPPRDCSPNDFLRTDPQAPSLPQQLSFSCHSCISWFNPALMWIGSPAKRHR